MLQKTIVTLIAGLLLWASDVSAEVRQAFLPDSFTRTQADYIRILELCRGKEYCAIGAGKVRVIDYVHDVGFDSLDKLIAAARVGTVEDCKGLQTYSYHSDGTIGTIDRTCYQNRGGVEKILVMQGPGILKPRASLFCGNAQKRATATPETLVVEPPNLYSHKVCRGTVASSATHLLSPGFHGWGYTVNNGLTLFFNPAGGYNPTTTSLACY